jgi:tyrosinase
MDTTRRSLLIVTAAVAFSSAWKAAWSETRPPVVRYNATSAEGKAMLRIYAEGVKAMKALGSVDPISWDFQWYIHATPKAKAQLLNEVFGQNSSVNRDLASETWFTCQSHLGQPEDYFLPWHRLYVAQFERIIASITSHPEFTLPYWDYTSAASYAIPEEFQSKNKNDPVLSALFVGNRNVDGGQLRSANVNDGEPLNKHWRQKLPRFA